MAIYEWCMFYRLYLCCFRNQKILKKSWGIYADPKYLPSFRELVDMLFGNYENTKCIKVKEYCTNNYSLKDFKILKVGYPPIYSREYEKWKWEKVKEEIY